MRFAITAITDAAISSHMRNSTDEFAVISGSLNALQNQPSRLVAKEKAAAQKRL
jgi:hypothetical protein